MNRWEVLLTVKNNYPGWEVEALQEHTRVQFRRPKLDRCKRGKVAMQLWWESQEFKLRLRHESDWQRTMELSLSVSDDKKVNVESQILGIDGLTRKCEEDQAPAAKEFMRSLGFDV